MTDFANTLFPGRTTLCVSEVAERLRLTRRAVRNLIEEGELEGVDVGGGGRKYWRIPVTGLERFLRERNSLHSAVPARRKNFS